MNFDHGDMPDSSGDQAQVHRIVRQVLAVYHEIEKPRQKQEIPAPLKWAGAIGAAMFTALGSGFVLWLASTVASTKDSTIRIEERQGALAAAVTQDVKDLKERVTQLESLHRTGSKQ